MSTPAPLSLADLNDFRTEVTIAFGDRKLVVGYRPNAYTGEFLLSLPEKTLDEALVAVLADWNLTGADGELLPITQENLARLGVPILRKVLDAIDETAFPNLKSAAS